MLDGMQSLLLTELFEPNCSIKIKGEHYFADKDLYTNLYGAAFYSDPESIGANPYVPLTQRGILDEYFSDDMPAHSVRAVTNLDNQQMVMKNIDRKYIKKNQTAKKDGRARLECSFSGNISMDPSGSVIIHYGVILPSTLCFTGDDTLSAMLPFSPFSNITFLRGARTMQSVDYPISHEPFAPPEDITIDFAATAKKLTKNLDSQLFGSIEIEYAIDVGGIKCENSKIRFEISPHVPDNENDDGNTFDI